MSPQVTILQGLNYNSIKFRTAKPSGGQGAAAYDKRGQIKWNIFDKLKSLAFLGGYIHISNTEITVIS